LTAATAVAAQSTVPSVARQTINSISLCPPTNRSSARHTLAGLLYDPDR
jgi:hypothetical protein